MYARNEAASRHGRSGRSYRSWALLVASSAIASLAAVGAPAEPSVDDWIAKSLEQWFSALARASGRDAEAMATRGDAPFTFLLTDPSGMPSERFGLWVREFRSDHGQVEFRIAKLTTSQFEEQGHRVTFSVERRSVDASGLPHVARSDHTWHVQKRVDSPHAVTSVRATAALVFPGTGPQIICF